MTDTPLPQLLESSARAFQRDIYFYWSTARARTLSLTKDRRLYQRDLRLVNDALLEQQELGNKKKVANKPMAQTSRRGRPLLPPAARKNSF